MSAALTIAEVQNIDDIKKQNQKQATETDDAYKKRINELIETRVKDQRQRLFSLQLANPKFVRTVRMPDAGTITTHTLCGADTKSESSNISSAYEVISTPIQQAKSVYESQNKKK
jgi:hypothetical protein